VLIQTGWIHLHCANSGRNAVQIEQFRQAGVLFFGSQGACLSQLLVDSRFHSLTIPISTAFPVGSVQQGLSAADKAVDSANLGEAADKRYS